MKKKESQLFYRIIFPLLILRLDMFIEGSQAIIDAN